MLATHRTAGEALGPAIRIPVKRVMADPALGASSRTAMTWLLLEGRRTESSASLPFSHSGRLDPPDKPAGREKGRKRLVKAGRIRRRTGRRWSGAGPNWLELARIGRVRLGLK